MNTLWPFIQVIGALLPGMILLAIIAGMDLQEQNHKRDETKTL